MTDENGNFKADLLDHVRRGSVELMPAFLRNSTPNLIDQEGKTLLHYAAESNNVSMTRHFISNNHDIIDITDNHGNSPLMLAMVTGSYDTAKMLVQAGTNIYSCNSEAARVLLHEARTNSKYPANGYHEIVKTVLQKLRKDCCNDEQLLLQRLRYFGCSLVKAISLRDANVTKLMLKNGYSVDERELPADGTALHRAVYLGDLANVELLLRFGADVYAPDRELSSPIFYLFQNKRSLCSKDEGERAEILKVLIQYGALHNLYEVSFGPTRYILRFGRLIPMTAFMQFRTNITAAELFDLIDNRNDDVFDAIRDKNIDVNAPYDGLLALPRAVSSGIIKNVQFLLERDADPNVVDVDGQTPLTDAFTDLVEHSENFRSLPGMVRLLLFYGADAQHVFTDDYQQRQTVFDIINDNPLRQEALASVVAHLALKEDCGGAISDIICTKIVSHIIYIQHFLVCKNQIEEMKETTVNGYVTLYKLLTESIEVITKYARSAEFTAKFEEAMNGNRLLDPYYSFTLHKRVGKAIQEARLRKEVDLIMHEIFSCVSRSYPEIFSKVLDYLTWEDMENVKLSI